MTAPVRPRRPTAAPAARPPRRRRRLLPWLLRALLVLLPLAALGWVLLFSPYLAVERVSVTGTSRLTVEQVTAAARVVPGTPLARVRAASVADRVRDLPEVRDLTVRRSWPDTLVLEVVEREPAVAVAGPGGLQLLDSGGVSFAAQRAAPDGVPRLEVRTAGPQDPATLAALRVLRELTPPLRAAVAVLRAPSPVAVELQLVDGRRVVWGAPGDADTKGAAVEALLRLPGDVVDVSAPGLAVRS